MRPNLLRLILILIVAASCVVAVAFTQKRKMQSTSLVDGVGTGNTAVSSENVRKDMIDLLQRDGVAAFHKWNVTADDEVEEHNLLCIVREFDSDPKYEGRGVKLSIFDRGKGLIYEDTFTSIDSVSTEGGRYDCPPQLILNVNYGGNANFLQILGYRNSKVYEMLNEMHRSGFDIRPQFRSSVVPAKEYFQVLVTEEGLASPFEKFTSVYRYKDGKYQYVGKFSQQKADDFIEKRLSK